MKETEFNVHKFIKLFTDAIGQDAFADFYGTNWQARKKELQKLQKTEIHQEEFHRFMDILNDWANWAQEKNYINSWDKQSICVLSLPFIKALVYSKKDLIDSKEFLNFVTMYAISYVFLQVAIDCKKNNFSTDKYQLIQASLFSYNFWLASEKYTKTISPIEGVFTLFLALMKDKNKLVEFWSTRKDEIQNKVKGDLQSQINRWISGKQRPTWKMMKLFLNEDLKPDDSMLIPPFDEESDNGSYLFFRRKLFSACFITKFFASLSAQNIITVETKEIIHKGILMFYKHFFSNQTFQKLSTEEISNPMFCMMLHFLIYEDMGNNFDADADFYFFKIPNYNMFFRR